MLPDTVFMEIKPKKDMLSFQEALFIVLKIIYEPIKANKGLYYLDDC